MGITVRERSGVQIVRLVGDFTVGRHLGNPRDLQGRPLDDLRQTIEDLLQHDRARIVLDLEKVRFIDSAGLGELIACKKRAQERSGDIKILHPGPQVEEVLVLTLLTQVFEIYKSEGDAVASFTSA